MCISVSKRDTDVLTSHPQPPPERLDLILDRHCMSLHHVPFSSPSLRFLGWTKHIVLTHHCLIMLEFIGTLEPSSTGLPLGLCLTPHCYRTTTGTRATQLTPLIQPKADILLYISNKLQPCGKTSTDILERYHYHPFIHLKIRSSVLGVHAFVLEKRVLTDGFVVALKPVWKACLKPGTFGVNRAERWGVFDNHSSYSMTSTAKRLLPALQTTTTPSIHFYCIWAAVLYFLASP